MGYFFFMDLIQWWKETQEAETVPDISSLLNMLDEQNSLNTQTFHLLSCTVFRGTTFQNICYTYFLFTDTHQLLNNAITQIQQRWHMVWAQEQLRGNKSWNSDALFCTEVKAIVQRQNQWATQVAQRSISFKKYQLHHPKGSQDSQLLLKLLSLLHPKDYFMLWMNSSGKYVRYRITWTINKHRSRQ